MVVFDRTGNEYWDEAHDGYLAYQSCREYWRDPIVQQFRTDKWRRNFDEAEVEDHEPDTGCLKTHTGE